MRILHLFLILTLTISCHKQEMKIIQKKEMSRDELYHQLESQLVDDRSCLECHKNHLEEYNISGHQHTSGLGLSLLNPISSPGGIFKPREVAKKLIANKIIEKAMIEKFLPEQHLNQLKQSAESLRKSNLEIYVKNHKDYLSFHHGKNDIGPGSKNQKSLFYIGSGKKGQVFVKKENEKLWMLPLSWAEGKWTYYPSTIPIEYNNLNQSPMYSSQCTSCHTTFANLEGINVQKNPGDIKPESIRWGVGCQKCHGPGKEHINLVAQGIKTKDLKIENPKHWTHKQRMDLCNQCNLDDKSINEDTRFLFPLTKKINYSQNFSINPNLSHGNTSTRFMLSKCYQKSNDFNCITCHGHQKKEPFSSCLGCHQNPHLQPQLKTNSWKNDKTFVEKNCINCHMPRRNYHFGFISIEGDLFTHKIRDHLIVIDKNETENILKIHKK